MPLLPLKCTSFRSNRLVFGPGLLSTLGEHHRKQRKLLNPVFSMRHMRGLLPIFYPLAHQVRLTLADQVNQLLNEDILFSCALSLHIRLSFKATNSMLWNGLPEPHWSTSDREVWGTPSKHWTTRRKTSMEKL